MLSSLNGNFAVRARSLVVACCLGCPFPALAEDLTAGIYLQIPLGQAQPFYGLRAGWQPSIRDAGAFGGVDGHRHGIPPHGAVMEWRNHFDGSHELLMNDTRLVQMNAFRANGDAARSGTDSGVDGHTIAAVIVGAALVAAIVNADSATGCVGTACPPPDRPDPPAEGD
jgi:hypothetical protein